MQGLVAKKIAVLGSSSAEESSPAALKAYAVGRLIADRGATLLTGACPGLPHAAVRGALDAGGLAVGISPAMDRDEHASVYHYPDASTIMIYTGMGRKGRNVVLIRSADACVFVNGSIGTLNEFTIAFDELHSGGAIGILLGVGGIADELPRLISLADREPVVPVVREADPERLMEIIFTYLCNR